MKSESIRAVLVGILACCPALFALPSEDAGKEERLWRLRNLGKAFYENPTTQQEAVEQFRAALELAPQSVRERVNYGLALLRAGKTKEGVAELEKAQRQDASVPHTWFNLGIAYKKEAENQRAIEQFNEFVKLRPTEAAAYFNLGYLHKLSGNAELSVKYFEQAAKMDPNLAGPHFQLYNAYRLAGRADEAAREQKLFQDIKKRQAGAAVPEDLEWSYFAEIFDAPDGVPPAPPAVPVRFERLSLGDGWSGGGVAVCDADGDGTPDLIAWADDKGGLWRKGGKALIEIPEVKGARGVAVADFDNDGLPDIAAAGPKGALLLRNGGGRFQAVPVPNAEADFDAVLWIDYDHDYDLDLLIAGSKPRLLRNNGASGFSDQSAQFPFEAGRIVDAVTFGSIPDTDERDIATLHADGSIVLYRDKLAGRFEPRRIASVIGARRMLAVDWNNDSWTDLIVTASDGTVLLRNSDGQFQAAGEPLRGPGAAVAGDFGSRGLPDVAVGGVLLRTVLPERSFAPSAADGLSPWTRADVADFDRDGWPDIAAITASGEAAIFFARPSQANRWIEVKLAGVRNLRIPYGADVEVKAGASYQKQTYRHVPLLFGLGSSETVDTVRITWPNGLVQNEVRQAANRQVVFKEAQRLSGSCPMIYTWNGREHQFITDVLGVAPLGAAAGDAGYFPVDHDEYIQIPGNALRARDGRFDIRVTEELREVSYLDQIRLIAVDHPSSIAVVTNDKFKSPPFPDFRLYGVRRRIAPTRAVDDRGNDVLARIARADRTYADTFERDANGVASLHSVTLDFAGHARSNRSVLILSGWVDWADGSTFKAVDQERKRSLVFPYLQVRDVSGEWRTVIEDMGIPAGKPKTIAVDLTGRFLSDSREIRIVSSLCLYWDEVYLSEDVDPPAVRLTTVAMTMAHLRFGGFAKAVIHPQRLQPESFMYSVRSPVSSWNPTPGHYTRYGDTESLLEAVDDRMVIMGSGDELALEFDAIRLPVLPAGWTRDFLLYVDGWAKDADANTAYARSVEPLPFHAMSVYPYPAGEQFPAGLANWREQYNTRPALRLLRPLAMKEGPP